ncbi:MAG: MFS transporter [Steroidobacteraceae bacterium]|nr:MFS transporter [Steroidobacteraceae bacterium]MDW8258498.1 MFS transporter [Gammaproteobacteria bacterium]
MKNVYLLMAAQALAGCGMIMLVTFGGIAGSRIAPFPQIATLPLSLAIVGVAAMSLPAALIMQRIGRKRAFIGSALAGAIAAVLCAVAIGRASFVLLSVGAVLLGGTMAFVQQYRFAAVEYVPAEHTSRAVATVLLGTLIAALIGPLTGQLARDLGGWREFTGSYLFLALFCVAAALVLTRLEPLRVAERTTSDNGRPLAQIVRQPAFVLAVGCAVIAYAVMSFIMTATPISMHEIDGFSSGATSAVITGHLLGMYLPSLATPFLVRWLGLRGMMLTGIAAMTACVSIAALLGHHFHHYFVGLFLLGAGWNLMFVAATTQLTRCYAPSERFRAQGFNDLLVFGTQALASLGAGAAIQSLGWVALNLWSLPPLVLAAVAVLALSRAGTSVPRG